MDTAVHNKLVSFIWSIADDCLRDVYVRGKYRDVILPMVVLRRIDTLLEPSKTAVMEEVEFQQAQLKLTEFDARGLQDASGYVFYNTSKWTLQTLHNTATNSQQMLQANFDDYLNGFSSNVKEIIDKFNLRSQIKNMADNDILLSVLEKFTSPNINFTPHEKLDSDGRNTPPLTNLGMGYVFEELIRKFNEENNEEAGEHFTPREVIELMTNLVFKPLQNNLPPIMTIYDPACGSGGMLTEAQNFIQDPDGNIRSLADVYLYGKERQPETYAICKSDMMIKGNDPENIRCGSTLSTDEFAGTNFDFMLSNPPYGKSWASEQKYIKDGKEIIDSRFIVKLKDYWGNEESADATPRSSDGQLLFLMEMVSKMKPLSQTANGSRIASVHNGSSLFTGDAGGGESNIRRYIIENDLLDAIIQLPNNLFYNTGITTYIWLLSNNKLEQRKGKVQLIEASGLYRKLRKNLGQKNCEFVPEHIDEIYRVYQEFQAIDKIDDNSIASKIFANHDFGYHKVNIERPQRLKIQFTAAAIEKLRFDKDLTEPMEYIYTQHGEQVYSNLSTYEKQIIKWCEDNQLDLNAKNIKKLLSPQTWQKQLTILETARQLYQYFGDDEYLDFNLFSQEMTTTLKQLNIKLNDSDKNQIINAISAYDENAAQVIKKTHKLTGDKLDQLLSHLGCKQDDLADFGYYATNNPHEYIEYESSSDLRDSESIPLTQNILDYFNAEVKPHVAEAWINLDSVKIGYEISFNKYFYRHKPLRSIEEVAKDILELERQSDGLIHAINNAVTKCLDPNVPMKYSGIEWLGQIPAHWEVKKNTYVCSKISSGTTPTAGIQKYYEDGNINWLQTGDLNDGTISNTSKKITKKALQDFNTLKIYPKHSTVIAMYGATIGKTGYLELETSTNQACCVLVPHKNIYSKYSFYWFNNSKPILISLGYGGGQPNISQDLIKNQKFVVPPIEEQKQIADFLDKKTAQLDDAILLKQSEIEKLKEYKATLIDSAVTGKIKV